MNRQWVFGVLILIVLILPFTSASWLSDIWDTLSGKGQTITGNVAESSTTGSGTVSGSGTPPQEQEKQKQSCCFCAYNDTHEDTPIFLKECDLFFEGKAHPEDKTFNCDVKEKVKLSEWDSEFSRLNNQYQCSEPLHLYHAQHGPVCEKIAQFIQVCVSEAPSCNLDVKSLSCQSFNNLDEVEMHFASLREKLGDDIEITACGNRLDGLSGRPACTLTSIVKVSKKSLSITPGPCQSFSARCSPANEIAYQCINASGLETTQRCCKNKIADTFFISLMNPLNSVTGVFGAEGASCNPDVCVAEGEQCNIPGLSASCVLSTGEKVQQYCCKEETASSIFGGGVMGAPGKPCPLPRCTDVKDAPVFCSPPGTSMKCLTATGDESQQACCNVKNTQGTELFPLAFLSKAGEPCNCTSFTTKKSDFECLSKGQISEKDPLMCIYTPQRLGALCGTARDKMCDEEGFCGKSIRCERDADCYKEGKKYCNRGEQVVSSQSCNERVCTATTVERCEQDKRCKENIFGASCIVQKPKTKVAIFFDDLFGSDETISA